MDHQRLLTDLQPTCECVVSLAKEEIELCKRCVAAPIFGHTGTPVAALSVSVPLPRSSRYMIADFGNVVRATAQAIPNTLASLLRPS